MKHIYNYLGECIDDVVPEFISEEYGMYTEDGRRIVYWSKESDIVDSFGFDKTNVESNGQYIEDVELPQGTRLCRFGSEMGRLTTLCGTKYEKLGLPYVKETVEYHEYIVSADGVSVKCIVTKGRVAQMFDSIGGAVQFLHKQSIKDEIRLNKLREVSTWIGKKNMRKH